MLFTRGSRTGEKLPPAFELITENFHPPYTGEIEPPAALGTPGEEFDELTLRRIGNRLLGADTENPSLYDQDAESGQLADVIRLFPDS